jgi:hypothetical protein
MLSRKRVAGTRGVMVILAAATALLGYNPAAVPTSAAGRLSPAAATTSPGTLAQQVAPARTVAAAPTSAGTTSPAVRAAVQVGASSPASLSTTSVRAALSTSGAAASAYIHYYLWWTDLHWHDKLGASYPYSATPLPLPGSTDASGCTQTVRYAGATIVDVPSEGLYNQNLAATFDRHIAAAAAAGVRGFVVSWIGNGTTTQSPTTSSSFNSRLDLLVSRVNAYNAAHATPFGLALGMSPYGNYSRPATAIVNDLTYFSNRYGTNSAFANRYGARPLVMLLDSRKFAAGTLRTVSTAVRGKLMLLGDETASSWGVDGTFLDGTSYYWSSEKPTTSAGASLATLAGEVHAAGKIWLSPFIAGYSRQLLGGTCVPRNGLTTLDSTWAVNGASHPDGWMGISWNEFVENTYLEPSLAYGTRYLDELHRLIAAG